MSCDSVDAHSVYEFTVKKIDGEEVSMQIYKGLVLLIVNVASRCGFTANNYKDLVSLDNLYRFDFFDKIDVNGKNTHPLYKYLKSSVRGTLSSAIKWNFTKFIVDRLGKPVERHAPYIPPMNLCKNIETYLNADPRSSKTSGGSKSSKTEKKGRFR